MRRDLRLGAWIAVGIVAGLLLASVVVHFATRTQFGHERVRRIAVGWLADRVQGELHIGRITGTGLLRGVVVHDLTITDTRGRLFLRVDSARAAYDWRTLLRGQIVIGRATLYQPLINIERLPGDTLWNYQHVFADTSAVPSERQRNLILFRESEVVNGIVTVRTPWEPDGPVLPADTARLILEDVPGGVVNVWRFAGVDAQLGRVLWESPAEEGKLFEVRTISAETFLWRDPLDLRHARGTITLRDSLLTFDVPEIHLPASRASALGTMIINADRNLYDVRINASRFTWRDLQWLYPTLPDEGGGSLALHIQSQQPAGMLWLVQDARVTAPGTQLAGTFGLVYGDTIYFTDVDLRASPLDLDLIESLLPGVLPVEGLLLGTVEVSGPLSALETSGTMQFASTAGRDAGSVSWGGTLDVRDAARPTGRLRTDLRGVDLAWFAAAAPALPLDGRLSGRVELTGGLARGVRMNAELRHALPGRTPSQVSGGGTVRRDSRGVWLDLLLQAEPLSIEQYLAAYPALAGFAADVRGPVRLSGRADSLSVAAEIGTRGGGVRVTADVRGGTGPPHYTGTAEFTEFRVDAVAPELPETLISGSFAFDLAQRREGGVGGAIDADLTGGSVAGVPLLGGSFRGALQDGLLRVDSASVLTGAGGARASGSFGIAPGHAGALDVALWSDDLEPLEPVLFAGPRAATDAPARVTGTLRAAASLLGGVSLFDLDGTATLAGVTYDATTAARVQARFTGRALRSDSASAQVDAGADSLALLGHVFVRADAAAGHAARTTRVAATARDAVSELFRIGGVIAHEPDRTVATVEELHIGVDGDVWSLRRPGVLALYPGSAMLESVEFARAAGSGSVQAAGRLAWRGGDDADSGAPTPLDFALRLEAVPVRELLRLTRNTTAASAVVDGTLRITGTALEPLLDGVVAVDGPGFRNARLERADARFSYADRRLTASLEALDGGARVLTGRGVVPVDLSFTAGADRWLDEPLDVIFDATAFPLATVLGLVDGFGAVYGGIHGSVALRGTTRQPVFEGALAIADGAATFAATGVRYRDVNGVFETMAGRLVAVDATARTLDPRARGATTPGGGAPVTAGSPGTLRVTGTLDLDQPADPRFNLTLRGDELLAARRRDADATISGTGTLGGRFTQPVVGGSLRVDRGALYLDEIYRQYLIVDLEDPRLFDAIDTTTFTVAALPEAMSPFIRNLEVDNLRVAVGSGAWLRSRDLNVEVSGDVSIVFSRQRDELRLTGNMQVVRGTYQLYFPPIARRFDVQQGTIDFPGTPGLDPSMAITAVYRAKSIHGDPLEITAHVTGTLESPRIRLSSTAQPPISESDLASYLFFGAPTNALAVNSAGGSTPGFGEFGLRTFGPSALGFVASGLQTLAQSTGIIDYIGVSAADATPGQSNAGIGSVFADAQLDIGLYLAPAVFVAFTQRLASPSTNAGVRLEWRFHPTYTAEVFAEDRFARAPSFGLSREAEAARKVYGFFLFREFGY